MQKHFTATTVLHRENGDVLLIFHRKLNCWLCPGGHIEPDELPDDAALREVYEETGLHVRLVDADSHWVKEDHTKQLIQPLCILKELIPDSKYGEHIHIDLVYRAHIEGKPVLNEWEAKDIAFFSREDIQKIDIFENVRSVILRSFELWDKEKSIRQ